uniref:Nucleoprotein n=1 Tax=Hubei diptera virus 6 TaxID=1922887 RepID=A0A8K1YQS0_9VIRU|nr:MAG: hypothetical protein [Hubei diptera virus 6]
MENTVGTPFTSLENAKTLLALPQTAVIPDNELALSGETVESLNQHSEACHSLLLGITPKELSELYGGVAFKFNELESEFSKICPDYVEELAWDKKSIALDFAAKVIFTVGPESRSVKHPGTDKKWKFRVIAKSSGNEGKYTMNTIFVCTFKNTTPPSIQPVVTKNKLVLTIKQASLLSLTVLAKSVQLSIDKKGIIMTPLAGAIFAKQDIDNMCSEIFRKEVNNTLRAQVVSAIIQSCQSGGQHLTHSKCHIALVAAICATKNMKDKKLRDTIISKTYKQYVAANKQINKDLFVVYAKYATGGVPAEYAPERLIELYELSQVSGIKAVIETKSTTLGTKMGSSIDTLSGNA